VPSDEGRHHRAAILYAQGREAEAQGRDAEALKLARAAFEAAPGLAPATAWYAELLAAKGSKRRARRALEAGWRAAAHPALAAAYGALYAEETPLARVRRFERLSSLNPDSAEGRIALAGAALKARLWGEARRHLSAAGLADGSAASPRLCSLMAALEEGERGDGETARRWRERAAAIETPDPAYQCNSCGLETPKWSPICPRCRGFDQLIWRRYPGRGEVLAGAASPADAPALPVAGPAARATPSVGSANARAELGR
jgi:HemY protein